MTTEINSIKSMLQTLDEECPDAAMYRGQSKDWPLLPSIGRYPNAVKIYENWQILHEDIIEKFLRLGKPYLKSRPEGDFESWVIAQHHGLPTRLIDTATNPLKALFFAVGDPSRNAENGVLWVFSFTHWREELEEVHRKYWDNEVVPFFPAQIHERVTAQEGAFLCYPMPTNTDPLLPIDQISHRDLSCHKYIIPADCKRAIRHEISVLGAKRHLLFPDLDGVASSIRNELLEY